jgi:hypothetical protein
MYQGSQIRETSSKHEKIPRRKFPPFLSPRITPLCPQHFPYMELSI